MFENIRQQSNRLKVAGACGLAVVLSACSCEAGFKSSDSPKKDKNPLGTVYAVDPDSEIGKTINKDYPDNSDLEIFDYKGEGATLRFKNDATGESCSVEVSQPRTPGAMPDKIVRDINCTE